MMVHSREAQGELWRARTQSKVAMDTLQGGTRTWQTAEDKYGAD